MPENTPRFSANGPRAQPAQFAALCVYESDPCQLGEAGQEMCAFLVNGGSMWFSCLSLCARGWKVAGSNLIAAPVMLPPALQ